MLRWSMQPGEATNEKLNVLNKKGNVVEVSGFGRKPRRRPEDKWGKGLISLGFCTVPSILMWAQGRLGLTTEQFTVVLQLADFWWDAGEAPYPTKELLAGRMGMGGAASAAASDGPGGKGDHQAGAALPRSGKPDRKWIRHAPARQKADRAGA
jgi:hypothetical protein